MSFLQLRSPRVQNVLANPISGGGGGGSTILFRKTLSGIGTHAGGRQIQAASTQDSAEPVRQDPPSGEPSRML